LNGNTYTSAELGSVTGTVKVGNSAAPYVGFGWGNPTSPTHRVQFLFDVGAIYSGTPSVTLTAQCAAGVAIDGVRRHSARCARRRAKNQRERQHHQVVSDRQSGLLALRL
jgi:hypothetical protein